MHYDTQSNKRFQKILECSQDIASKSTNPEQKKAYQTQANNADKKIENDLKARKALHESSDPVIAFAAKNDFNLVTLLVGLVELLVTALLVMLVYKFFVQIINAEKKIFDFVLKIVFFAVGYVFYSVAKVCFGIANFFSSQKKQTAPEEK